VFYPDNDDGENHVEVKKGEEEGAFVGETAYDKNEKSLIPSTRISPQGFLPIAMAPLAKAPMAFK